MTHDQIEIVEIIKKSTLAYRALALEMEERRKITEELDYLLLDEAYFYSYEYSCKDDGTTENEILSIDEYYISALYDLCDKGYIYKVEDRFHAKNKEFTSSNRTSLKNMEFLIRNYPYYLSKNEIFGHSLITDTIDDDSYKELMSLSRQYVAKTREVLKMKKNGKNHFFQALAIGLFSNNIEGDEK